MTAMETEEMTAEVAVVAPKNEVIDVTVHPLVLLSAADHYHRVARGTRKRVVGILLGSVHRGRVDATNSFAVPFEEDSKNPVRPCAYLIFTCCTCLLVLCILTPLPPAGCLLSGS